MSSDRVVMGFFAMSDSLKIFMNDNSNKKYREFSIAISGSSCLAGTDNYAVSSNLAIS